MTDSELTLDFATSALRDMERLRTFLAAQQDPLAADFLPFMLDAIHVLLLQPGIGRPVVAGRFRELIVERGHSGYLVRYHYSRTRQHVAILRIRHQRECGYLEAEAADENDDF